VRVLSAPRGLWSLCDPKDISRRLFLQHYKDITYLRLLLTYFSNNLFAREQYIMFYTSTKRSNPNSMDHVLAAVSNTAKQLRYGWDFFVLEEKVIDV
jgi:hypothetical protein